MVLLPCLQVPQRASEPCCATVRRIHTGISIAGFQGKMTENNQSIPGWAAVSIVMGIAAIVLIAIALPALVSPPNPQPAPTVWQMTSMPTEIFRLYQPEILPPPTNTPPPTRTATAVPTNTPFPTRTPFILPTLAFDSPLLLLPDLTVSGIGSPICVPDREGTVLEIGIFIRNIGQAGTRNLGSFDVDIFLLMGQQRYGLDEWAEKFNGVVGVSPLEIFTLDAGQDVKLVAVIDLKGNKSFGIQVIVNAGDDPMREADMSNNTLTEYFSAACY